MKTRGWLLAAALAALASGCEDEDEVATRRAPVATARATAPRTATQIKECRDACEQTQIVAGVVDDAMLRACRDRCTSAPTAAGPHEVPRSITRAPAAHTPPPVAPLRN